MAREFRALEQFVRIVKVKLPKKDKERFKVKCVKEGKSMSNKIRTFIKKELE